MTAPLVRALPFIEGETLSGYVSRLAQLYQTTPRELCSDLGNRWPYLCSGREDQLWHIAWLTGHDYSTLKLWSATKLSVGRYRVGNTVSSTGVFRRTASRCCPRCVFEAQEQSGAQGIFELLEWKVLSLHRCEKHGVPLLTLPSARHSHEAYDFVAQALTHWALIEEAADNGATLPKTQFESYIRERIRNGPQDDWLVGLDLTNLYGACLNLGAALEGFKAGTLNDVDGAKAHELSEIGHQYLATGPSGLKRALTKLRDSSRSERPYFSADFGPFYHWLRVVWDEDALAQITVTTREFVFSAYPVPLDKEVFGEKPKRQIWLTMQEARKRSGFGAVFLKHLLGHMQGVSEEEALRRTDVHVKEIERAKAFWDTLMNLNEAAALLNILPQQVKALQNRNVLSAVRITSSLRYLLRAEVLELLAKINALPVSLPEKSVLPLKEFCRTKGTHLARVIKLWEQGELEGKVCRGDGDGLQAIEVDLDAFCDKAMVQLDRDLTLPETASYLKISVISIRHLRDHGYLTQIQRRNPDTNHLKNYLSQSSIQEFERNYITLGQMASRQKVASIHLARQLDRDDIHPIICGKEQVRVYDRKSIGWWEKSNV